MYSAFHEASIEALKTTLEVSRLMRCKDLEDQEEPGEVLEAAHPFPSLSPTTRVCPLCNKLTIRSVDTFQSSARCSGTGANMKGVWAAMTDRNCG